MGAHMKNTIELSDPLFKSAKQLAKQSRTTLRALVEEGLRRVLAESPAKAPSAFKLQNASVHGKAMLITDPRQWQAMEAEHVAARALGSSPSLIPRSTSRSTSRSTQRTSAHASQA